MGAAGEKYSLNRRSEQLGAGELLVISVEGELDIANADEFRKEIATPDEDSQIAAMVLDLDRVAFVDSSALRTLLLAKESMEEAGRRLILVARERSAIGRLLEMSGLADRIARAASVAEAKAGLG